MSIPYIIGIDIGGTKCATCISQDGNLIVREEFRTDEEPNPEAVVRRLAAIGERLLTEHQISKQYVVGVGVSCGGPLDAEAGLILSPPNLPGWDEIPAKRILEEALYLEAKLENDANATAVAEWKLGAGRGLHSLAFLTVGTGLGAGLILDDRLYRGKKGMAGEVGHTTILPDGPDCLCGKRGCLEALASGSAIGRNASHRLGREVTGKQAIEMFQQGDPTAKEVVLDAARYLGIGLANLLQTLDLQRIILGTIAIHAGDEYLATVTKSMREHCWPRIWEDVDVVPCGLGDRAQDYAAISLWLG